MRDNRKNNMKRVFQVVLFIAFTALFVGVLIFVTQGHAVPVLQPKGLLADKERDLILLTVGLSLIVVIPVFIMLFSIAWRYRASNTKAKYQPEFASHKGIEALWWGIPCLIILVLAIITGIATHALDPYKSLNSPIKPINVQVIALQWKWLFIYPDQKVATLNYVNIPSNTPINLTITSDAPMNSFWVPALAGQVYAMSGMTTQLHIMADGTGSYNGSSANISGEGFANMRFVVNSMTPQDFQLWVKQAKTSRNGLSYDDYQKLAQPSKNIPNTTYTLMDGSLYNKSIMKYMSPSGSDSMDMSGMTN